MTPAFAAAFLSALTVLTLGAQAATQKLWDVDPDTSIEACSKILRGKERRKDQAVAFANRAYAYGTIRIGRLCVRIQIPQYPPHGGGGGGGGGGGHHDRRGVDAPTG